MKYQLYKNKNETFQATVLLVKDLYIVGRLNKHPKVIVFLQCKGFNEFYLSHEVFERHSTVKFKALNSSIFDPENTMQDDSDVKKSSNAIVGEIFTGKKKEDNREGAAGSDNKLKPKIKEGETVTGNITKISPNNIFVALSKSM